MEKAYALDNLGSWLGEGTSQLLPALESHRGFRDSAGALCMLLY